MGCGAVKSMVLLHLSEEEEDEEEEEKKSIICRQEPVGQCWPLGLVENHQSTKQVLTRGEL